MKTVESNNFNRQLQTNTTACCTLWCVLEMKCRITQHRPEEKHTPRICHRALPQRGSDDTTPQITATPSWSASAILASKCI